MSKFLKDAVKNFTPMQLAVMVDESHQEFLCLMKAIEEVLEKDFPNLFGDIQVKFMHMDMARKSSNGTEN